MTVRELLDRIDVGPLARAAIRATLLAMAPGALEAEIGLSIDPEARTVRLTLGGAVVLDTTFEGIESYVQDARQ